MSAKLQILIKNYELGIKNLYFFCVSAFFFLPLQP